MRLAMRTPTNAAGWKSPGKPGAGGLAGALHASTGCAVVPAGGEHSLDAGGWPSGAMP